MWSSFCKINWCLRQEQWASPPPSLSIKARARAKAQPAARGLHFSVSLGAKLKVFSVIVLQISVYFVSCLAKSLFQYSPKTSHFWVPVDLLTTGYSKGQKFSFSSRSGGGAVCSYLGTPSKTLDRKLILFLVCFQNLTCSTSTKNGAQLSAAVAGSDTNTRMPPSTAEWIWIQKWVWFNIVLLLPNKFELCCFWFGSRFSLFPPCYDRLLEH